MQRFSIPLVILVLFFACAAVIPAQQIDSIFDDSVDKSTLDVKKVAIIPNRLPLVLQEPEQWRLRNWRDLSREFRDEGYDVLGYYDTKEAAKKANLPLEDTLNAEAKYAEFCRLTDTDLVVMPYYGTSFSSSSFLLMVTNHNYTSTVSYQYYTPRENIFFHRADASKTTSYSTGVLSLAGMGVSLLGGLVFNSPAVGYVGTGLIAAGSIWDVIQGLKPADQWWAESFDKAVPAAADPMLSYLGSSSGGGSSSSSSVSSSSSYGSRGSDESEDDGIRSGGAFEVSYGWFTWLEDAGWQVSGTEGDMYLNNVFLRYLYQFNNFFSLGAGLGIAIDQREGPTWEGDFYEGGTYAIPTFTMVFGNKVDSFALGMDLHVMTVDHWADIHGAFGIYFKNFFFKSSPIYFATEDSEDIHESYFEVGYSLFLGD